MKYQPIPQLLIRSSASKGFRAPTLYDVFTPNSKTYTANKFNDPLRCRAARRPMAATR